MLRRNLASEFVAGAYVFPGGRSTPRTGPRRRRALPRAVRRGGQRRSLGDRLGRAGVLGGRAARVLRGGRRAAGPAPGRAGRDRPARHLRPARRPGASRPTDSRSTRGAPACSTCAGRRDWSSPRTRVHYVSHWITPELAPKRYDTRFFVTAAPPGQVAQPRRRGDHRQHLDPPRRRAGPVRGRRASSCCPPTVVEPRRSPGPPRLDRRGLAWARAGHRRADGAAHRPDRGRAVADPASGRRRLRAGDRRTAWPPISRSRRSSPPFVRDRWGPKAVRTRPERRPGDSVAAGRSRRPAATAASTRSSIRALQPSIETTGRRIGHQRLGHAGELGGQRLAVVEGDRAARRRRRRPPTGGAGPARAAARPMSAARRAPPPEPNSA